jgi:NADH-ubiquinone oxidoreductase chain 6
MYNLNILTEDITNGLNDEFLSFIFFISVLCGIWVVINKNPIVSVLYLIGLYLSISVYLVLLGLSFIGLSYLLVYVGAVSILFLFILMLINIRISEILTDTNNSLPLAVLIGSYIYLYIYYMLFHNIIVSKDLSYNFILDDNIIYDSFKVNNNDIFMVSSKLWDGFLIEISHITNIGNILYTSYSIWLIIASIILLLAMIGSISITIKK